MISLWIATSYLIHKGKYRFGSLITAIPAAFMSSVTLTYILMADEGFRIPSRTAYPAGIAFAVLMLMVYAVQLFQWKQVGEDKRKGWKQIEKFHAK